jgi:hypothetical protein
MTTKYTKLSENRKMAIKYIYQYVCMYLLLQDRPKFTQLGIFVLKIYHLATLVLGQLKNIFTYDRQNY